MNRLTWTKNQSIPTIQIAINAATALEEIPLDGEQSSSYFQYTREEVHEGLGQMDEGGLNHYHQNRQSPKKVVWWHPNIIAKHKNVVLDSEKN
jgi:hypothetical protein